MNQAPPSVYPHRYHPTMTARLPAQHRTMTTWVLIVVLTLATLLPSLAMASRATEGRSLSLQALSQELCSTRLARTDKAATTAPESSPDVAMLADCVWCQHHAHPLALPMAPAQPGVLPPLVHHALPSTHDALLPPSRAPPHDAPARAPPSLS